MIARAHLIVALMRALDRAFPGFVWATCELKGTFAVGLFLGFVVGYLVAD